MIRAVLAGAAAGRSAWWAPALVAAISATLIGLCLVQSASIDQPDVRATTLAAGFEREDLTAMGESITMLIVPTSVIVIALVASASVGQLTGDLARWRIAGAGPRTLGVFVMTQLVLVTLIGGACGAVITAAIGGPAARFLNGLMIPELEHVSVHAQPGSLLATVVVPAGIALLAGLLPARRGGQVSPVRAVVGEEELAPPVGVLRWVGTVLGLLGLVAVTWAAYGAPTSDLEQGGTMSIGLGIGVMVLVTAGLGARVLVPALLAGWTRLLPVRHAAWELARAGAVARARISGSTVVALACGCGILGMLTGMARTEEAVQRAAGYTGTYNYVDMYVICAVIGVMSAVGGICVLALNAADRRREVALLRAAGMTARQITAMAAGEAVCLAGTAVLIALVATLLPTGIVPWTASHQHLPVRFVVPWAELAIAAALTVAVILVALLVPARKALRTSVRDALASV